MLFLIERCHNLKFLTQQAESCRKTERENRDTDKERGEERGDATSIIEQMMLS